MHMYVIKVMKKQYMCTIIIGSSERVCALIILFQLYAFKDGLFRDNLFWERQYDTPNLHIGRKTNPILI